jgi:hypothetical protein
MINPIGQACSSRTSVVRIALIIGILVAIAAVPVFARVVNFPNPDIEVAIRKAIEKPTGNIYDTDLIGLKRLSVYIFETSPTIEGLQYCVDLEYLALLYAFEKGSYYCYDIGPLSGLTNLTEINLVLLGITDISALSNLTNLTEINLAGNHIVDISPLSGLTNLTKINLTGNDIVDISPLVSNPGLGAEDRTCEILLSGNCLDMTPGSTDVLDIDSLRNRGVDFDSDLEDQNSCAEFESNEPAPTPAPTPYIPPYTPAPKPADLQVTWEYRWNGNPTEGVYVAIEVRVENTGTKNSTGTSCWFGMEDVGNWYYDQTDFRDFDIAPGRWVTYTDYLWVPFDVWTRLVIIVQNDQGLYIRQESRNFHTG